jgi:antitoxin component YwqK of YwqJK toxin-antitoxin module
LLIQPQECTLRTFHESGKLASEEIYTIEAVHVQWQRKDVMGLPQIVEPKIEGLKTGTWRTFRPSGELSWQGSYENDLKHGVFEHYQNGGLQRSENYLLDVPSGDWVWYFQAGVVERQCQYNAGKLHGKYLENYANGQLKLSAEYVFDSLVGRYESYFETGQLMESGNYGQYAQAGQRIGTWLSFYEDGRKKAQGTYLEGVKTGTWTYWDESGKKRKEKYE